MKYALLPILLMAVVTAAFGQAPSPAATASVTINGKAISIRYSAPSVRGRQIFGEGGQLSKDPTYPVWRAGANAATVLHTDADLDIAGLLVPKGDYSLYVNVKDPEKWQLIVNKQTRQSGLTYDQAQDLGRVPMTMSKPPAPIETYKITLSDAGGGKAKLQLEWDKYIASVPIAVK
jgi:Protein of unknown function (DUF2911)